MPARHVRKIAALGSAATFGAKAHIVSAGDPGNAFYVLLAGRAEVRRGRGRPKVEIGPGAYFGEMALLDGAPRSATVVAKSETIGLMLSRAKFEKVLRASPPSRTRCFARSLPECASPTPKPRTDDA